MKTSTLVIALAVLLVATSCSAGTAGPAGEPAAGAQPVITEFPIAYPVSSARPAQPAALAAPAPGAPAAEADGHEPGPREPGPREPGPREPGPHEHGPHEHGGDGSTHELAYDSTGGDMWVTGQNEDMVTRVGPDGEMSFHPMPAGSGPHGIVSTADGSLFVGLEFAGAVVQLDRAGAIVREFDLVGSCASCAVQNPGPHGLAVGPDGETLWFTGKEAGSIGRIGPDGTVTAFPLPDAASKPIYIVAGSDGAMWFTELIGNAIGRIDADGRITEYPIPSAGSRPIALGAEPGSDALWFTEEATNTIGRITPDGAIAEFALPSSQANLLLAALAFDVNGDMWVQQYVDENNPEPAGPDKLLRVDGSALRAAVGDGAPSGAATLDAGAVTAFDVPSTGTVMHRIRQGAGSELWFTELATNVVGRLEVPVRRVG